MDYTSLAIVECFEAHPSVHKIKSSIENTIIFSFRKVTTEEMLLQWHYLDPKKGSPQETIPPQILQSNPDMFCFHLTGLFNNFVEASSFQMA